MLDAGQAIKQNTKSAGSNTSKENRPNVNEKVVSGTGHISSEELRKAAESVNPQERARYAQFFLDLRKRGQELGIDVPIPIN